MTRRAKPRGVRAARLMMGVILLSGALCTSLAASAQITSIDSFPSRSFDEARAKMASDVFTGQAAFAEKNYSDAITNWEAALSYSGLNDFERARIYIKISQAHAARGQYDQAKNALRMANDFDPRCDERYHNKQRPRSSACQYFHATPPRAASSPQ